MVSVPLPRCCTSHLEQAPCLITSKTSLNIFKRELIEVPFVLRCLKKMFSLFTCSEHNFSAHYKSIWLLKWQTCDVSAMSQYTVHCTYACLVICHFSRSHSSAGEPQVIDYQSQQLKLFPYLAMAFAFTFSGKQMQQMFAQSLDAVSGGNFNVLPEVSTKGKG